MNRTDIDIQAPKAVLQQLVSTLVGDSGIDVVSDVSEVKTTTSGFGLEALAHVATAVSALTGVLALAVAVYETAKKNTGSQIVIVSPRGPVTIKWHAKLTLDEIKDMIQRLVL